MKKLALLPAMALAAAALSGSASAATITETIQSTIAAGPPIDGDATGVDLAGLFGPTGASLVGDAVTFSYSYDPVLMTANGQYSTSTSFGIPSEQIYDYANDSAVTVSVTINSQTYSMTSNDDTLEYATDYLFDGNTYSEVGVESQDGGSYAGEELGSAAIPFTLGEIYNQSFDDGMVGSLLPTSYIDVGSFSGGQDILYLTPATSSASATPEPATWISLAFGVAAFLIGQPRNIRAVSQAPASRRDLAGIRQINQ